MAGGGQIRSRRVAVRGFVNQYGGVDYQQDQDLEGKIDKQEKAGYWYGRKLKNPICKRGTKSSPMADVFSLTRVMGGKICETR